MRKSFVAIIIGIMCCMVYTGCKGKAESSNPSDKPEIKEESVREEEPVQDKEQDSSAEDDNADTAGIDADKKSADEEPDVQEDAKGDSSSVMENEDNEPFFGLWVGSFTERHTALDLADKLRGKGLEAYCIYSPEYENLNKEPYWCVTLGKSGSEPEAQALIKDAESAGYKDAYVKYTGDRLSHRIYYFMYSAEGVEITNSKVTLNDVPTEDLSGTSDDEGERTLIVDEDTVFDETCDMQYFPGYENGETPLVWFGSVNGEDLMGVFEVGITGNHIDSFYGSYWWD